MRRAPANMYAPGDRVVLLRHARQSPEVEETQPLSEASGPAAKLCSREACENPLPNDPRRRICDACRIS